MCREHAAQLRDAHPDITARGGDVIVIGTGDARYAKDVKDTLGLPFPVLVDDDGSAARVAALKKVTIVSALRPGPWVALVKAMRRSDRTTAGGKLGARVSQLGATFVVGPGARVRYEHLDRDIADHAPMAAVLAAL